MCVCVCVREREREVGIECGRIRLVVCEVSTREEVGKIASQVGWRMVSSDGAQPLCPLWHTRLRRARKPTRNTCFQRMLGVL